MWDGNGESGGDFQLRLVTVRILVVLGGLLGIGMTIPALADEPMSAESAIETRLRALRTLEGLGVGAKAAVPQMAQLAADGKEDLRIRRSAIRVIAEVGSEAKTAVPTLAALAKDRDESSTIRLDALMALGEIGRSAKAAVPTLLDLIQNESGPIRQAAFEVLDEIGAQAAEAAEVLARIAAGEIDLTQPSDPVANAKPDADLEADAGRSPSMLDRLIEAGDYTLVVRGLRETELTRWLSNRQGQYTLLAPTDEAFRALGEETVEALFSKERRTALRSILLSHVLEGQRTARDLVGDAELATINGSLVYTAGFDRGRLWVGGAPVVDSDRRLPDGAVVHGIDRVLLVATTGGDGTVGDDLKADSPQASGAVDDIGSEVNPTRLVIERDQRRRIEGLKGDLVVIISESNGVLELVDLEANELRTELGDRTRITISGRVGFHDADLGGSAILEADALETATTEIEAFGASRATVRVRDLLIVRAAGAAWVQYVDPPSVIRRQIQGGARLVKLAEPMPLR